MATSLLHFTLLLLATLTLTFRATGKPTNLGTEKLTHLKFYFHDRLRGSNPTTINNVPITSIPTAFGNLFMNDDPLTEKPEIGSKMLGRGQGLYGVASQEELGLMMAMNFVFTTGRFNRSTLTVLGMYRVPLKTRELPVVGGSGIFRLARGYVQMKTSASNETTKDATVRCNVYVYH